MRILAFLRLRPLLRGDQNIGARPLLRLADRIDSSEFEDEAIAVIPHLFDNRRPFQAIQIEHDIAQFLRASRLRTVDFSSQFAPISADAMQSADYNPVFQNLVSTTTHLDHFSGSLQNFKSKSPVQFHTRRAKQRADGSRRSPLFSNDFSQVTGRDAELKDSDLFAFHFANSYLFRYVDKRLRYLRY